MLPRLRHDPLVGRDDHHHQVDAGRPGHHVPDEPLVARDIDDPEGPAVGKGQRGEPEFDRDPPLLFLLEPVGIHAGEALDQRRLAVIDMAGRAHHDMLHAPKSTRLTRFSQQQICAADDAEASSIQRRDDVVGLPQSKRNGHPPRIGTAIGSGAMIAMNALTSPLLTDLYQLTMLEAYLSEGMEETAVFEFYVRDLPADRGFLVAAGLESLISFLENCVFRKRRSHTSTGREDFPGGSSIISPPCASPAISTPSPRERYSSPTSP